MLDIYDTPIEISVSEKGISEKGISTDPTASVIWLHGLGADGTDFVPVVNLLNLPHVRFILPHAAFKKVTANMAMKCALGTMYLALHQAAVKMRQACMKAKLILNR